MVTPYAQGTILATSRTAMPVPLFALTRGAPVLVLTPHPDDETLGCGGAIAAASANGVEIVVACLTDGTRSHPNSIAYPRHKLAALRQEELRNAVNILTAGHGKTIALGIPDQAVTPDSLAENRTIEALRNIISSYDIGTVWTTWKNDPHVDHRGAAEIAFGLCQQNDRVSLWQFPIWSRFTSADLGPGETLYTYETGPYWDLKRRAIAAHTSQMSPLIDDDPGGFMLDLAAQNHFLNFPELFIGEVAG